MFMIDTNHNSFIYNFNWRKAFRECSSFTRFIIPSSVISIGEDAFGSCLSLAQIAISSSVTST